MFVQARLSDRPEVLSCGSSRERVNQTYYRRCSLTNNTSSVLLCLPRLKGNIRVGLGQISISRLRLSSSDTAHHKRPTTIRPKSILFHELSYIGGISFEGPVGGREIRRGKETRRSDDMASHRRDVAADRVYGPPQVGTNQLKWWIA